MTSRTVGEGAPPSEPRPRVQFPMREIEKARTRLRWLGRVAPFLASRIALRYFLLVRQHPRPAREEEWLARATRFEITGTNRLSGFRWGQGRRVLLVHGWEGRGTQMGAFATALAAAGREVVAFDAPGHGRSEGYSSLRQFAIAVRDVVAQEGPFDGFIGHSFGVAGACFALTDEGVGVEALGKRLVFVAPPDDLHFFVGYFERLLELSPRVTRGFERRLERLLRAPWAEARFCTSAPSASVPLLIVADQDDQETPIQGAEALAEAWPMGRLLRTQGLGHRRILRDPEVVRSVVDFLDDETE